MWARLALAGPVRMHAWMQLCDHIQLSCWQPLCRAGLSFCCFGTYACTGGSVPRADSVHAWCAVTCAVLQGEGTARAHALRLLLAPHSQWQDRLPVNHDCQRHNCTGVLLSVVSICCRRSGHSPLMCRDTEKNIDGIQHRWQSCAAPVAMCFHALHCGQQLMAVFLRVLTVGVCRRCMSSTWTTRAVSGGTPCSRLPGCCRAARMWSTLLSSWWCTPGGETGTHLGAMLGSEMRSCMMLQQVVSPSVVHSCAMSFRAWALSRVLEA